MRQRPFLAARIDQWSRRHPRRLDVALAALLWLVFGLWSAWAGPPAFLLATAAILPLAVRRRHPVAVLVWTAVLFGIQLVFIDEPLPANIPQGIVIYSVAAHVASLTIRLLGLGAALAGAVLAALRWSTPPDYMANVIETSVFLAALSVLVWVNGNLVRGRQANVRALHEANTRLEESRLQRERFAAQQRRIAAAQEIHDIVAHSLTVVIVQADGAEYAARHAEPWDRADAADAVATIGRTARSALTEVRGVIEVLRDPDTGPDEPGGGRPAQAGSAEMLQLVESVRAAGLLVDVEAERAVLDSVPSAVRSAVLRVVQESLTNVLKHAGPHATARVTLRRAGPGITIRVEDDGVGARQAGRPQPPATSYGLVGMAERLRELGGVLETGSPTGGGFVVEAAIPITVATGPARPIPWGAAPDGREGGGR
ncbi:sensor histidine kinase [Nonomuraea spiralis]|uniref:histidine kinase n=1 Tax=Nonomuraea spiralis TaxID=46182 RepID=A0ABV5IU85_9ACTN|nr:histidine kinase [Nonomuraea spiralis]GGT17391.1 two-component sensor histidine kinase [Nonomuraea spiralis]